MRHYAALAEKSTSAGGDAEPSRPGGGPFRSFRFEDVHRAAPRTGALKHERLHVDEIDDAVMLADRAEEYRIEYDEIRPHEAIAWNRPREVHLGLADPTTPTFDTKQILPTP